ncbi:hypothetical protein FJ981_28125 [Mesorhizobium sp. B1-1-4]|uniref:DUF6950 family protein n=1 Tax=Mesorhizobium sp. B1-1-4 TaxID=2589980 RepID=UPI00112B1AA0|nr:hypothetical protein [Mesorhizobium sp. B1-1-4]TPN44466.1 hypothetical protein FJ981_28125 [Mesorhizobium sp. B1-1-4]
MNRLPDWPARLHDFIDGVKRSPFAWDGHDCFIGWAADAVLAMTGEDIAARYRGKYKTAKGGAAVLRRAGFDNLADGMASLLPEYPEGVSRAKLGDIAAIPTDGPFGWSLGIVNGETILTAGEKAMGVSPLLTATRAFRVG